jgi:CRP-like cAMP-binding protein
VLIRSGFAFRSCLLADGRRAILDILVPGDIGALDNIALARPSADIYAAARVGYHAVGAAALRETLADRCVMTHVLGLFSENCWRGDRLTASIARLDARARICVLLLDIYDRLRRRGLIARPTFNLPLTQEQIADHLGLTLVHVNRTLRRLREERVVLLDRQVVIILDLERLREVARDLPQGAEFADPAPAAQESAFGEVRN